MLITKEFKKSSSLRRFARMPFPFDRAFNRSPANLVNDFLHCVMSRVLLLVSTLLGRVYRASIGMLLQIIFSMFAALSSLNLSQEVSKRIQAMFVAAPLVQEQTPHTWHSCANSQSESLPVPVLRYMNYALREGQKPVKFSYLKQTGQFRFLSSKKWNTLEAEEWYSAGRPGFVWQASIRLSTFSLVKGFASLIGGQGCSEWRRSSLFSVDCHVESNEVLAEAVLARFLSGAPCCPSSLLPSPWLSWQAIDHFTAEATVKDGSAEVTGVFQFDSLGQITQMKCANRRPLSQGTAASAQVTTYSQYQRHCSGLMVPTELEVAWDLPEGEFSCAKIRIEELRCWDFEPQQDVF